MKALLALLPAAAFAGWFPSCLPEKPASAPPKAPPIAVQAAPVPWTNTATPVSAPGILARTLEADLSFKTGGVIAEVPVRAGDHVRAGQILARLRTDELDAAVAQAESALNKARRDLERSTSLFERDVEPLEKRQNAESGVELAEAALSAARFNRQTAELTAPAAGEVLARYAEPGEIAGPGTRILRFASEAEGWLVRAGLAQREVVRVAVGDQAGITFAGLETSLTARVARIAGETDPASRTTLVELRLVHTPPASLRSGMVGKVSIQPGRSPLRAVLPLSALVEGDGKTAHVFQIQDSGKEGQVALARRVRVELDEITPTGAVLRSGLEKNGALVVITSAELLVDGAEVLVNPAWPLVSK